MFFRLSNQIDEGSVDPVFLRSLEEQDCIFPDIDFGDLFPANGDETAPLYGAETNA